MCYPWHRFSFLANVELCSVCTTSAFVEQNETLTHTQSLSLALSESACIQSKNCSVYNLCEWVSVCVPYRVNDITFPSEAMTWFSAFNIFTSFVCAPVSAPWIHFEWPNQAHNRCMDCHFFLLSRLSSAFAVDVSVVKMLRKKERIYIFLFGTRTLSRAKCFCVCVLTVSRTFHFYLPFIKKCHQNCAVPLPFRSSHVHLLLWNKKKF